MNRYGIVHPQMLARLQENFYPSRCTIKTQAALRDSFGQQMSVRTVLLGHANLPCRIAPRGAREVRSESQVYAESTHIITLNDYYPDIISTMTAVVDAIEYGIDGVEWDGNRRTTRMYARLIR